MATYREIWDTIAAMTEIRHVVAVASMQAAWNIWQAEHDTPGPRTDLATLVARQPTHYAEQFAIAAGMMGLTPESTDAEFVTAIETVWDIFAGSVPAA